MAAARLAVRLHLALYLVMAGSVLGVWAAVAASGGPGYFWPVRPLLGGAVGFLGHAAPTRLCTAVRSG